MNSVPYIDICHFQDSVRHIEIIISCEKAIDKRHKNPENDIKINIPFSLNIFPKMILYSLCSLLGIYLKVLNNGLILEFK